MEFAELGQIIGSYGFPAFCCIYMMTTVNKTIEKNTETTNHLCKLISMLLTKEGVDVE